MDAKTTDKNPRPHQVEGFFFVWGPACRLVTPLGLVQGVDFGNVRLVGTADRDNDGVPCAIENAAPNEGDGNGDGIPDAEQADVASLSHPGTGTYVTLALPEPPQLALANVSITDNPWPDESPEGMDFPLDFLRYSVVGVEPGTQVSVAISVHEDLAINAFQGVGPTPAYPYDHWYPFVYNGFVGVEVPAEGPMVMHLADVRENGAWLGCFESCDFQGVCGAFLMAVPAWRRDRKIAHAVQLPK